MPTTRMFVFGAVVSLMMAGVGSSPALASGFDLGPATSFGVLFEGGGGNTLQVTNVTVNGDVGVGNTGMMTDSGPSTINGTIFFSASNTGQFTNNNGANVFGGPLYNQSQITTILNNLGNLNITLGAEAGTGIAINGSTTINASAGTLDANGNRVFTVTSFNTTNSNVLTINGAAGQKVVINFITGSINFNNQVALTGGITAADVLYNFVGGSNLTGGPTLQINDNASGSPSNIVQGYFLDPNGAVSVVNANVVGGVFGGDSHDFQYVSGSTIQTATAPEPASLALLGSGLFGLLGLGIRRRRETHLC